MHGLHDLANCHANTAKNRSKVFVNICSHYFCTTLYLLPTQAPQVSSARPAVQLLAACGNIGIFLRTLVARFSTSCVLNVLVGKPQKHGIFTSCVSLHVLARALFLCCIVPSKTIEKSLASLNPWRGYKNDKAFFHHSAPAWVLVSVRSTVLLVLF